MARSFEYEQSAELHIADLTEAMLDDIADDVADFARRIAPVDTGDLRRNIDVDSLPGSRQIGSRVPYSAFVEQGTVNSPAQPFLRPALYRHR